MKKYLGVAYVAFYMYVYIRKLDKDLNIQMCKMQVNRHTKQKHLCQCHIMKLLLFFLATLAGN